jgi:hypothetical protein
MSECLTLLFRRERGRRGRLATRQWPALFVSTTEDGGGGGGDAWRKGKGERFSEATCGAAVGEGSRQRLKPGHDGGSGSHDVGRHKTED